MVSLKIQKRLAASVMKRGKEKVLLDPNESADISMANSHARREERLAKGPGGDVATETAPPAAAAVAATTTAQTAEVPKNKKSKK